MIRLPRFIALGVAAAALSAIAPLSALAEGRAQAPPCPPAKAHSLPRGSAATTVIRFGVKGGSLRPWSVKLALGGSISATGTSATREQLTDPKNALAGLLTLADAEGFSSLKKTIGCVASAGNPDVSTRFISIHTSTGTKSVQELGSCAATSKYDQLFTVVQSTAGIG
jgi:hypothetical protein